ncbi:MAG: DUF975 family protein [Clostridia bacterium]|nr:DUF975 family protein [Clostridia bacterium]NCC44132.1 DUF975 family protein [Clostridia bacterium]
MKYSSKELKAMSRNQLAGQYGTYIGAFLIYLIIDFVITFILNAVIPVSSSIAASGSSQSGMLSYAYQITGLRFGTPFHVILYYVVLLIISLILSVLMLGIYKMFLDGSRGYPVQFADLFYGFRHHPDRVILMQLLGILISVGCMLPGYIFLICAFYFSLSPVFIILAVIVTLIGCVFTIIFEIAFSQCMFLMADYDDLGPVQAYKESLRLMRGNKGRYFWLLLSFIGIMLLGALSCYVGLLWAYPYMMMTMTNFYRNVDGEIPQQPSTSANI